LGQIDIALDPFPFNGHTTMCHSMWMGAPVITLAGQRSVARVGVSVLTNLGLSDLIASSPDQYLHIAAQLAGDLPRLEMLRSNMRQRMRQSPLMDSQKFTQNLDAAYREAWVKWCSGGSS
jgi:predicted O-linked N-acetylglucosamine transferase (SPINDLY family)